MDLTLDQCLACGSYNINNYLSTKAMMHSDERIFTFDRCADCRLVFLNPRVDLQHLSDYYTDYYLPYRGASAWGRYAPLVEKDQMKIDTKRAQTLTKYVQLTSNSHVLDIGCGKPSFLQQVAERYHCHCTGTDFSDEGWKHSPVVYDNIRLHHGLPTNVPLSSKADAITMWHYLEHDYDPHATLMDIQKYSHDNTTLIIEVPDHDGDSRKRYRQHWSGYHTPRHTGLYNIANLSKLLERSGWSVVDRYRYGTLDPYTLIWMSEMERQQIDWSASMESRFWGYVSGMLQHYIPLRVSPTGRGFMTVVAKPKSE